MKDLYFIEGRKERKAFLTALKELEEEGFEVPEKTVSLRIARKALGNKDDGENSLAANSARLAQTDRIGATPAELSTIAKIRRQNSRVYTETTAVDMKDFKYWRQDELEKRKKNYLEENPFSLDEGERERASGTTLFDELFDTNDERNIKETQKPQSYLDMESLFEDKENADKRQRTEQRLSILREIASEQTQKAAEVKQKRATVQSKKPAAKPKTAPKRKYKKKMDADIKMARRIVVD